MPKNKQKTHSSKTLVIVVLILLVAVAVAGFFVARYLDEQGKLPDSSSRVEKPSEKTSEKPSDKKPEESEDSSDKPQFSEDSSQETTDKTPERYSGADANTYASLTGSITSARVSGDNLVIRVNIDQYLTTGICSLSLSSPNGSGIIVTADIIPEASTSSCEGFDIPLDGISSFASGPVYINIDLTSGDRTGVISGETSL